MDADIDARNPRTRMRHLPAGLLSRGFGWGFVAASALVFLRPPGAESALPATGAAGPRRSSSSIPSPSASPPSRTWSWASRWGSRRRRPGSRCRGSLDPRILWLTAAVTFWTAGLRRHLLLPGLRIRLRRGAVQRAARARHRQARCASRRRCTS